MLTLGRAFQCCHVRREGRYRTRQPGRVPADKHALIPSEDSNSPAARARAITEFSNALGRTPAPARGPNASAGAWREAAAPRTCSGAARALQPRGSGTRVLRVALRCGPPMCQIHVLPHVRGEEAAHPQPAHPRTNFKPLRVVSFVLGCVAVCSLVPHTPHSLAAPRHAGIPNTAGVA